MPTYYHVQDKGKLIMQSREKTKNLNLGNFSTISRPNIPTLQFFLKNRFYSNWRSYVVLTSGQKPKKIVRAVFEKNISVWFWANLETFSRISPNQEFFSKIRLSLFYLYSPLTSCKKSEKSLEPFLRKLRYQPTNQPTNYYQQHRSCRTSLTPVQQFER